MKERASITDDIDLSDFKPTQRPAGPSPEAIRSVSDAAFPSRQAVVKPTPEPAPRMQRRYTTGRTVQLHLKATPEFHELFFKLCDQAEVKTLVEGFERAVLAWKRELDGQ